MEARQGAHVQSRPNNICYAVIKTIVMHLADR